MDGDSLIVFIYCLDLKGYYTGVVLIIAVLLTLAGGFQACKKLIKVTRAFVDAEDE